VTEGGALKTGRAEVKGKRLATQKQHPSPTSDFRDFRIKTYLACNNLSSFKAQFKMRVTLAKHLKIIQVMLFCNLSKPLENSASHIESNEHSRCMYRYCKP
jgi:hypothetical protein